MKLGKMIILGHIINIARGGALNRIATVAK